MRRNVPKKRVILPMLIEGKLESHPALMTASKFVNHLMENGKKSVAERIIRFALAKSAELAKQQNFELDGVTYSPDSLDFGLTLFEKAIENVKPVVEVRSRRVGGATYQVPMEVRAARQLTLAMRWLIGGAKQRSEKGMGLKLAREILDAAKNVGSAIKKKEDVHRMAKANQAFAHFRWN
jgi:small subunit ribosomal protein S7